MNDCIAFLDYLEQSGGSERFDFWQQEDGEFLLDERGNYIPDMDAAREFGQKLREQNSDVEINISTNVVRVKVPVKTSLA